MKNKNLRNNVDQAEWQHEYADLAPSKTIFYTIERTIKQYKKYAQHQFDEKIGDITVDQALVLSFIEQRPDLSQSQIAALVFKDNASITRMIDLIIKKGYLKRAINHQDRRKFLLKLTPKARETLSQLRKIRTRNRATALSGISADQLSMVTTILEQLISNCQIKD